MQSGWRVGSLFGIPLYIDPSWFWVLALIAIPRGAFWEQRFPAWGAPVAYGAGLAMALLLFGSVLLHELGHSLVARSQGIKVNSITLFLFGGVAAIDQESKTPGQAFQVAIAGPLVSFALFILLASITRMTTQEPLKLLTQDLAAINLVLGLFNLLPGLPLDGGQILKSLVWKITGSRFKGVHWAARSGKFLGWLAVFFGVTLLLRGDFGGLWIALLGWFGVQNASSYDRVTDLQESLLQLKASNAMTRDYRVVDAQMSLRQFADTYVLDTHRTAVYYAAAEGRYKGIVAVEELHLVDRQDWDSQTLMRIVHPLDSIPTTKEADALVDVIRTMETLELRRITVLTPAGAIAGIIDRGDIVRALGQQMNTPVPDALIKQIKDDGAYPPGLQLGAIVQSLEDVQSLQDTKGERKPRPTP
jgi:Zn-dependent protease/CBS domain-containing protein